MPNREGFQKHKVREEKPSLEARLNQIEGFLSRLPTELLVDPVTGQLTVSGGEATASSGGNAGGGAGDATALLNSGAHFDTETGTPVQGDLIVVNANGRWARYAKGTDGYVLQMVSGVPVWQQPYLPIEEGDVAKGNATILDFGPGFDVSFVGTEANVTFDAGEVLTGDVSYAPANMANVIALRNTLIERSVSSSDDGKYLKYDHTLGKWTYDTPTGTAHNLFSSTHGDVDSTDTPAGGDVLQYDSGAAKWKAQPVSSVATARVVLSAWRRDDIRNATGVASEMKGLDGISTGEAMAYSGRITGIALMLEKDLDNGGAAASATYTVTVYKSTDQGATWSATGVTVTLSAGASTERRAYATGFSVSFAAGDMLTCFDQQTNLPAVTNGSKASAYIVFD